jgi:hypothetical protein
MNSIFCKAPDAPSFRARSRRGPAATLALVLALGAGLLFSQNARAASQVQVGSASAAPGESAIIPISFQGDGASVALQFDLFFDDTTLRAGFAEPGPGAGHIVSSSVPEPGLARIVIYSLTGEPLSGGVIARIPFTAAPGAPNGTSTLGVGNLLVSNSLGLPVAGSTVTGGAVTVVNERAPIFESISVESTGAVTLRLLALEGRSYAIQRSTDLRTWQEIATGTATDGVLTFTDPAQAGTPYRFYRAVAEPE